MPLIKGNTRTMQDGTRMTQYTDTVGPAYVTYTTEAEQEMMIISNKGLQPIVFIVGTTTGTIQPGDSQRIETYFTSFQVKSTSGIQQFEVRMDEVGTVGGGGGGSSEEVEKLDRKVDSLTSELAQNTTEVEVSTRGVGRRKETIVTFTSDDGKLADYTKLKPIFEAKGVPCTLGIITSWVGNGSTNMTLDQIKELRDLGWEIASHTVNHPELGKLATEEEIEYELKQSKETLINMGFDVKNLIYPFGSHDSRVRKIARKYYKCATDVSTADVKGLVNTDALMTYGLKRVSLGSYFLTQDPNYPPFNSLEFYKMMVDEAIKNKAWLIFVMHPNHTDHDDIQQQHLAALIDYIKSKSVPILNLNDGLSRVGNLIDTGDYIKGTDSEYTIIASDGNIHSKALNNYGHKVISSIGIDTNTPISDFPMDTVSVAGFKYDEVMNFPTRGGTLETYRFREDSLGFQIWHSFVNGEVYRRRWNYTNNAWYPFERIDPQYVVVKSANDAYSSTSPLTAFPEGKITFTKITYNNRAGFPDDLYNYGILETNRIDSESGYPRQIFRPNGKATFYERYWKDSAWSAWSRYAQITDITNWTGVINMNTTFQKLGNTKVSNYIDFEKIHSTGGTQSTLSKSVWTASEISSDSTNPTTIATAGAINVQVYKDTNNFVYIKYSANGNNYPAFIKTSFC